MTVTRVTARDWGHCVTAVPHRGHPVSRVTQARTCCSVRLSSKSPLETSGGLHAPLGTPWEPQDTSGISPDPSRRQQDPLNPPEDTPRSHRIILGQLQTLLDESEEPLDQREDLLDPPSPLWEIPRDVSDDWMTPRPLRPT